MLAQQFLTGEYNNVSSATLRLLKIGSPTGTIDLEIWDDDGGGYPGKSVGTLGTLELESLPTRFREFTTLETRISGLTPDSPYYLVISNIHAGIDGDNTYDVVVQESYCGADDPELLLAVIDDEWLVISDILGPVNNYLQMSLMADVSAVGDFNADGVLQAGDADQDLDFDQLDLVKVQVAAKYLTGQPATWGEGDWDGAPGGAAGNPPTGNGLFDQLDVITALGAGRYLTGPYAAVQRDGHRGDDQASVMYNAGTGELAVDAPANVELTSINIDSTAGIFTGRAAANLGGSFDSYSDRNIFKATFGGSFGSVSFGNVAQPGLSEEFVLGDLSAVGSLAGGGELGNVDFVYVPEPTAGIMLAVAFCFVAFQPFLWRSPNTLIFTRCGRLTGSLNRKAENIADKDDELRRFRDQVSQLFKMAE